MLVVSSLDCESLLLPFGRFGVGVGFGLTIIFGGGSCFGGVFGGSCFWAKAASDAQSIRTVENNSCFSNLILNLPFFLLISARRGQSRTRVVILTSNADAREGLFRKFGRKPNDCNKIQIFSQKFSAIFIRNRQVSLRFRHDPKSFLSKTRPVVKFINF